MTDAQWLIDSARSQFNHVVADVERHFDKVASQLKDFLSSDMPFTPRLTTRPPPPPPTTYESVAQWISKHRAITAAFVAFAVTGSVGSVLYYQQHKLGKKRRAARSASGARTEVVVLAGAINSPIASNLALDLERRGYIVYAVAGSAEDQHFVRSFQRIDLLPLQLDLGDAYAAQDQLLRFKSMLDKEHVAFDEAEPHKLQFRGVICVPDSANVPSGSVESIASEEWSDAVNAKVLNTIATMQLFLPLLKEHAGRLLLLTPSVSSSLLLPGHSLENTITGALNAFTATLATEMRGAGVPVTHFKLGDLDIPSVSAKQRRSGGAVAPRSRATPIRKLQDSVFDALSIRRPARTWHVGRGSLVYGIIGAIAPATAIHWLMESSLPRHQQTSPDRHAITASATWERVEV